MCTTQAISSSKVVCEVIQSLKYPHGRASASIIALPGLYLSIMSTLAIVTRAHCAQILDAEVKFEHIEDIEGAVH